MLRKRGFTLVELLVVISIIALLMSILMPSLNKVRQEARAVVCVSNLRQLAICTSMYTTENNQFFWPGVYGFGSPEESNQNWFNSLRRYYGAENKGGGKIRICPEATKSVIDVGRTPFSMWQGWNDNATFRFTKNDMSSYAFNDWLCNPPVTKSSSVCGRATKRFWRSADVKGADCIPMFIDAVHTNMTPTRNDSPPRYSSLSFPMVGLAWNRDTMVMSCIERHMKNYVQAVRLDHSTKKVGLRQLWDCEWHRGYDFNAPLPNFETEASWMMKLRNY